MEMLDRYMALQNEIFKYFGYVEDWVAIPLNDCRKYHWRLDGEGPGDVIFALTKEAIIEEDGNNVYSHEIWTQRFLPKWVYRAADYTMVVCDTRVDGNKFLSIFDNAKEMLATVE